MKLHRIIAAVLLTGIAMAELPLAAQVQDDHIVVRRRYAVQEEEKKPDSSYRGTGCIIKFDLGSLSSVTFGYRLSPSVMLGCGAGVVFNIIDWGVWTPVYFEARYSTPRFRKSLFADLKVGYAFGHGEKDDESGAHFEDGMVYYNKSCYRGGVYTSLQIGMMFKNLSVGAGVGLIPGAFYQKDIVWGDEHNHEMAVLLLAGLSYEFPIDTKKLKSTFY